MRIISLLGFLLLVLVSCGMSTEQKNEPNDRQSTIETPEQAKQALVDGNMRFISGKIDLGNGQLNRIALLKDKQNPYAAIVSCSDSRVPVELIFDKCFGDLFVIRTAGNSVIDVTSQGSVDYAVNHLGVKLIVILGHSSCGAITGIVNSDGKPIENDGKVPEMLALIGSQIPEYVGRSSHFDEAIKSNADIQVENLLAQPHISKKVEKGELIVCSAIYDISTGKVSF